jgi:hypothetical protein
MSARTGESTPRRGSAALALVLAVLLAPGIATAADDVTVTVSLDRTTIGLDEQAVLEVDVSGTAQDLPEPQMPTLSVFEVYPQGRSSNISIVNGQVSASVTYRYVLLPSKAGTFAIGPIAVVYNNKRYKGNDVQLTVVQGATSRQQGTQQPQAVERGSDTRDYFLEADVDNKNPFVNEQVTFTLKFYIGVQYYGSPELTEPATTGFWTEVLGNKAAYYQVINNRKFRVIERSYALFPTQTGELTIGRAQITATVASRRNSRDPFAGMFGDFFERGEQITVRSQPVIVRARPLPEAGRPDGFSGTIGDFSISADADKNQVEVNQPVTLTVKIAGSGNIKSVAEPVIPPLDDFRVYKASSNENISRLEDKLGGSKVFEEVFIPKRPGELEIPSLSYSFFDPKSGKYKQLATRPIKVRVTKGEGYIASPDVPYSGPDLTISSEARDIRYIKSDIGDKVRSGRLVLTTPMYLLVNGLPVIILASLYVVRRRREKLAGNVGLARSRAAAGRARKRLAKARSLARMETSGEFYAEVSLALLSYIADKLNISPHGLTADKVTERLVEKAAGEDLVKLITDMIRKCDFARFAPSTLTQKNLDDTLAEAEDVMVRLEGVRFD